MIARSEIIAAVRWLETTDARFMREIARQWEGRKVPVNARYRPELDDRATREARAAFRRAGARAARVWHEARKQVVAYA